MEPGGVLRHGLLDGAHRRKGLIRHLYQLFGFGQRRLRLGHHQADGVAHTAGHVASGDHHVPVLLDVPHLVMRHILGGKHRQHAGEGQGGRGVDVQHTCPGVLRADG